MSIEAHAFRFIREHVHAESAIVLDDGKEYLVESRLVPLARQAGHPDVDSFVAALQRRPHPEQMRQVVEALTTNETSFFRDSDPFTTLRAEILPTLARARPDRRLKIWTAACSTGQEPYSVAITARETAEMRGFGIEILATDLSEDVLNRARLAEYTQLEVNRGLPVATLLAHFNRTGPHWRVRDDLTAMVDFRILNLARPFGAIGPFDVVFLRNVLIYFDLATKQDILRRVRSVMARDGYLVLGAAETTMGIDPAWERIPAGRSSVYRIKTG